ncbi:hypothetical protein B0H12DRAFT_1071088 [Mycena haematopus]|nr:hypothetical protein B0H12DRAFT_1071088 [Mycena haematopus]
MSVPTECPRSVLERYGYHQLVSLCPNAGCGYWLWHNPSTRLEQIPQDVQIRHALKASSVESGTPLHCPEVNCMTADNKQRRANRECERVPPRCSGCCKQAGGCRAHRLGGRDISQTQTTADTGFVLSSSQTAVVTASSSQAAGSSASSAEPRIFARPLNENYGRGYLSRHTNVLDANSRLEAKQKLNHLTANSVYVIVWEKASQIPTLST